MDPGGCHVSCLTKVEKCVLQQGLVEKENGISISSMCNVGDVKYARYMCIDVFLTYF